METNVGDVVQRAICRLFGHAYEVTHTNRWQVATRRECRRCKHAQEHRWPPGSGWHDEAKGGQDGP